MLQQEPYPSSDQLNLDYNFVLKKFGLSKNEFEEYLVQPRVEHSSFPNSQKTWDWLKKFILALLKNENFIFQHVGILGGSGAVFTKQYMKCKIKLRFLLPLFVKR